MAATNFGWREDLIKSLADNIQNSEKKIFFVTGPEDCGKTTFVKNVVESMDGYTLLVFDCKTHSDVYERDYKDTSKKYIIFIDHTEDYSQWHIDYYFENYHRKYLNVAKLVFAYNGKPNSFTKRLRKSDLFGGELKLSYMSAPEIKAVMDNICPTNSFSEELSERIMKFSDGLPNRAFRIISILRFTKVIKISDGWKIDDWSKVDEAFDTFNAFYELSENVEKLTNEGQFFSTSDMSERMLQISTEFGDLEMRHLAYYRKGLECYYRSDNAEAIKYLKAASESAVTLRDGNAVKLYSETANFIIDVCDQQKSNDYWPSDEPREQWIYCMISIISSAWKESLEYYKEKSEYIDAWKKRTGISDEVKIRQFPSLWSINYNLLALYYSIHRQKKDANNMLKMADDWNEKYNLPMMKFITLFNHGFSEYANKNYEKAILYLQKHIEENIQKFNYEPELAEAYQIIGFCYIKLKDEDKAQEYIQKAEGIYDRTGDSFRKSVMYYNIADIYKWLANESMSKEYLEKYTSTYVPFMEYKKDYLDYKIPNNIFEIYHKVVIVEDFYKDAIRKAKRIGDTKMEYNSTLCLCNIKASKGDHDIYEMYNRCRDIAKESGDKMLVSDTDLKYAAWLSSRDKTPFDVIYNPTPEDVFPDRKAYAEYLEKTLDFYDNEGYIMNRGKERFNKVAELYSELSDLDKEVSARLRQAKLISYYSDDEQVPIYEELIKKCDKFDRPLLKASVLVEYGEHWIETKNYSDADDNFKQAIKIFDEHNEHSPKYYSAISGHAKAINGLGNFADSLIYHDKLVRHYEDIVDYAKVAEQYVNLSKVYESLDDDDAAQQYFDKAMFACNISQDKRQSCRIRLWMGYFQMRIKKYQEGLENIICAIEGLEEFEDCNEETITEYYDLAELYTKHRCYLSAIHCYKRAYDYNCGDDYYDEYDHVMGISNALEKIGRYQTALFYLKEDYERVNDSIKEREENMRDEENPLFLSHGTSMIGIDDENDYMEDEYDDYVEDLERMRNLTFRMGKMHYLQGQYSEALPYFQRSTECYETGKKYKEKGDTFKKMMECAINLHDKQKALEYFQNALTAYKNGGSITGTIECYNMLTICADKQEREQALAKLEDIACGKCSTEDKVMAITSAANIANVLGDDNKTMALLNDAMVESSSLTDWEPMLGLNIAMADTLWGTSGRAADAEQYFKNAIKIGKSGKYYISLIDACSIYGQYLVKEKHDFESVYNVFDDVIASMQDDEEATIKALMAEADFALDIEKNYDRADNLLHLAHRKEYEYFSPELKAQIRVRLCAVYKMQGKYDKCFDLLEKLYNGYQYLILQAGMFEDEYASLSKHEFRESIDSYGPETDKIFKHDRYADLYKYEKE